MFTNDKQDDVEMLQNNTHVLFLYNVKLELSGNFCTSFYC